MSGATGGSKLHPHTATVFCVALILYGFVVGTFQGQTMQSADLFAMWLAGEFMSMGQLDQIYPANSDVFDMSTPSAWWPHVETTDPTARIFPYIYPPIWAKLVSFLTPVTTFAVFDTAFGIVHQVMLLAMTILAAKMCGLRGQKLLIMAALTYSALVMTLPIRVALWENQPQILVSFLIVFAFERAQAEKFKTAGALLALAAAIKVYPLLFLVIFAARRQWHAVSAFIIAGGALAATSVALAGWPLHAEYLHLLGVVSNSVIVTNFSFSIDAILSGTVFKDQLMFVYQPSQESVGLGWAAIAKTPLWSAVSAVAQISAIAGIGVLAAKRPDDVAVLPLAATLFALLSPLSWAYTYLPAYVFIGLFVLRLGLLGKLVTLATVIFFHPQTASFTLEGVTLDLSTFSAGGMALTVVMLVCLVMCTRDRGQTAQMPTRNSPAYS